MTPDEIKALRAKIRAEEIESAQKDKDSALEAKIRAEERENAREGPPSVRLVKKGVKELGKLLKGV